MSYKYENLGYPYYLLEFGDRDSGDPYNPHPNDPYMSGIMVNVEGRGNATQYFTDEHIDRAMIAFCSVLNDATPVVVTKYAKARGRVPGYFFSE
ncbi:hypothetical protein HNR23_003771 [Nocardiopsis mwathae]|uniref:Uncharacterized protein n=1 Tax=Nocardiopsis mwathae TaxID=1472723 RepID=A0A7W9YM40_9ACTN|nr:hypothetical protein [Nocardiopsis mwathae]MBB6173711.1 hypothetical protein [Nocardiopsis mwathae]